MASLPHVEVIICTYNRATSLGMCLESVRHQTYPSFDVLVVNGPSIDNTVQVTREFGVKLVSQQGRGIANARNQGIRTATADIIAFIDDDCTAGPDWLVKLVQKIQASGASGASGKALTAGTDVVEFQNGTVDIYGRGKGRNPSPGNYNDPAGKVFNNVVCMNVAFIRQAVLAVGGFDEYFNNFYEETDLCVRMIQAGYKMVHEPAAIVYHAPAAGPNRRSRWDQNWYVISRNTTYMPLKNFRRGTVHQLIVLKWLYLRRMASFLLPFSRGEITLRSLLKIEADITRGFLDGLRDGLRIVKTS